MNSDKTEFRCKDNIEISAVTGKIDQFILHAPVKFYSICKYQVNQLQATVKDILHGKCPLEDVESYSRKGVNIRSRT